MGLSDLIYPHANWNGTAGTGGTAPTESGTVRGTGFAEKAIACPDTGSYFWLGTTEPAPYDGDFEITVAAEHGDQGFIEEVEFWLEGNTVTVSTQSKSARTGVIGYSCVIDASACATEGDGDANLYITVRPVNGYERLLGPFRIHLNYGGTISRTVRTVKTSGGDHTSIHAALLAATTGQIVKIDPGTWLWDDADSGTVNSAARAVTIQPADGSTLGDVVISRTSRTFVRPRINRAIWRNIEWDMKQVEVVYPAAGASGITHHTFINNNFHDPDFGAELYYSTYGTFAVRTDNSNSQNNYAFGCSFECINASGPKLYVGCTVKAAWDTVSYSQTDWTDAQQFRGVLNTTLETVGEFREVQHTPATVTVNTATYDGGTGRTTVTLSGSPTIETIASGGENLVEVVSSSGVAVGTEYALVSQTDATDTIVLTGDASGLASGDTVRTYIKGHQDHFQIIRGGTVKNVLYQRVKATSPGDAAGQTAQPWLFQPGRTAGSGTLSSTGTSVTTTAAHGCRVDDYLRVTSGTQSNEVRRVVEVPTTTTATLESAFSADQSGVSYARNHVIKDVGIQLSVFDNPTDTGLSHWQGGHRHVVVRQATHVGCKSTFRDNSVAAEGFFCEGVTVRDSVWRILDSDSAAQPSGTTIDNNHSEQGTPLGTSTDAGDVTFDADYRPTAGLSLTVASPKLLWDYHGNPLANDGTDLVGAAQAAPADPASPASAAVLAGAFGYGFGF